MMCSATGLEVVFLDGSVNGNGISLHLRNLVRPKVADACCDELQSGEYRPLMTCGLPRVGLNHWGFG